MCINIIIIITDIPASVNPTPPTWTVAGSRPVTLVDPAGHQAQVTAAAGHQAQVTAVAGHQALVSVTAAAGHQTSVTAASDSKAPPGQGAEMGHVLQAQGAEKLYIITVPAGRFLF